MKSSPIENIIQSGQFERDDQIVGLGRGRFLIPSK
jgi:hypothetical protein